MGSANRDGSVSVADLVATGAFTVDANERLTSSGGSIPAYVGQLMPLKPTPTIKTIFAAGHGYTAAGTGITSNLNDTSDFAMGLQCVTITTNGAAAAATLKKTGMTSFSMAAAQFMVWFKIDNFAALAALSIYAGDTNLTNFFVHDLFPGQTKYFFDGEWVCAVIPWGPASTTGTPNRAAITDLQLRALDNSSAPLTVHWGGIASVPEPTLFSGGVVSICFDDGYLSQYTQARPKLDQYGFSASIFPIQDLIGGQGGTYISSLAMLQDLQTNHGWDICAHAYTVANHNTRWANLSTAVLDAELQSLKKWLTSIGARGHDHHAIPGGSIGAGDFTIDNIATIQQYFLTARMTVQNPPQAYPPARPYEMRSFTVSNTTTVAQIEAAIDAAVTGKYWLILTFHNLVAAKSTPNDFLISDFGTVVDYLNTKGVPIKPVSDVLAAR